MAYVVDRVVICEAFQEPERHYQLLAGGRSKLAQGRRPSMRFLASAKDAKGGIAGVVGREAGLFEDMLASSEQRNDFVNQLRDEIRAWRESGYPGTAGVTRRLLEWWFERDEERGATAKQNVCLSPVQSAARWSRRSTMATCVYSVPSLPAAVKARSCWFSIGVQRTLTPAGHSP